MVTIALLGATGHVGQSLIWQMSALEDVELFLYARAPENLSGLINHLNISDTIKSFRMDEFGSQDVDVIINAVGTGTPRGVAQMGPKILEITEHFDNLILDYLKIHSKSLYLFLSSGAVYGTEMENAANLDSELQIRPNRLNSQLYYAIAKLNSEAKHRGYSEFNIVDLRVFSYFSQFIDLDAGFFISDLAKAAIRRSPLKTNRQDFVRDFVSPQDFVKLILCCISRWTNKVEPVNACLDVYSRKPILKFDLLSQIGKRFDLEIELIDMVGAVSTGPKNVYFSEFFEAENWGYKPEYSSIDCIDLGLRNLLGMN